MELTTQTTPEVQTENLEVLETEAPEQEVQEQPKPKRRSNKKVVAEPEPEQDDDDEIDDNLFSIDPSTIQDKALRALTKALQAQQKALEVERATARETNVRLLIKEASLSDSNAKIINRFAGKGADIDEISELIEELKGTQVHQTQNVTVFSKTAKASASTPSKPKIGSKEWGAMLAGKK